MPTSASTRSAALTAVRKYGIVPILLVAAYLRLVSPTLVKYTRFMDRDCFRGTQLLRGRGFPCRGAELSLGGRLPGSMNYLLFALPLAASRNPVSVIVFIGLLNVAAVFLCYRLCVRYFDWRVGLLASALFATFPPIVHHSRMMWNPSFTPVFTILFFWSLFALIFDESRRHFALAVVWVSILIQLHFTYVFFIPLFVAILLIYRPKLGRRSVLIASAAAVLLYSSYLIWECAHSFANTRQILLDVEQAAGDLARFAADSLAKMRGEGPTGADNPSASSIRVGHPQLSLSWYFVHNVFFSVFNAETDEVFLRYAPQSGVFLQALWAVNYCQLFLFCAAMGYLPWYATRSIRRAGRRSDGGKALLALLWILGPLGMLFFYRVFFVRRYFILIYPAQFIVTALFLVRFCDAAKSVRGTVLRRTFFATATALLVLCMGSHCWFLVRYIRHAGETGRLNNIEGWVTLREKLSVCRALAEDCGCTAQIFRERVHEKAYLGFEDEFTYLFDYVSQAVGPDTQPAKAYPGDCYFRIVRNPPGPPGLFERWVPEKLRAPALTGEHVKILDELEYDHFRIVVYQDRARKQQPCANNFLNYYIELPEAEITALGLPRSWDSVP